MDQATGEDPTWVLPAPPPPRPDARSGALRARAARARRPHTWAFRRHGPRLSMVGAIACGGAAGAVAREALSAALPGASGQFPWGVLVINVSGSALLGFLLVLLAERFPRSRLVGPVLGTGFIGSYTTFSTYAVGAVLLARASHLALAATYVAASLLAGLLAVWAGSLGARLVAAHRR